jgi:hypothetical protein
MVCLVPLTLPSALGTMLSMSTDLIRDTYNALMGLRTGKLSVDESRAQMRSCRERAEADGHDWNICKARAIAFDVKANG